MGEMWVEIAGEDYKTPQLRQVRNAEDGKIVEVSVPLLPAVPDFIFGIVLFFNIVQELCF